MDPKTCPSLFLIGLRLLFFHMMTACVASWSWHSMRCSECIRYFRWEKWSSSNLNYQSNKDFCAPSSLLYNKRKGDWWAKMKLPSNRTTNETRISFLMCYILTLCSVVVQSGVNGLCHVFLVIGLWNKQPIKQIVSCSFPSKQTDSLGYCSCSGQHLARKPLGSIIMLFLASPKLIYFKKHRAWHEQGKHSGMILL